MNRRRVLGAIFKGFAVLAMFLILGLSALLVTLWREHRTPIDLPTPTGPFAVGRVVYDWSDDAIDVLAPTPGSKRELLVWIWYPTARRPAAVPSDYLPAPQRALFTATRGILLSKFLTRDLSKVGAHSVADARLDPGRQAYPVVIMRAGASLEIWNYTALAEDLASHGYVVVGFDAPYRTGVVVFPDGKVIRRTPENNPELVSGQELKRRANRLLAAWTADIGFVLDRLQQLNVSDSSGMFTGRLDLAHVGVFGHSFGGATAAQFCSQDSRCKAGIDLDGSLHGSVIQSGIHQPFMFLLSGLGDFSSNSEIQEIVGDIRSVYERMPPDRRLWVVIQGAGHFTFSDDGALLKSQLLRAALHRVGKLGIDGRRQLAITSYCIHSFFDAGLAPLGAVPLNIRSPLYSEIQVVE
ncbi:MAG: family membership [Acidobacteria bacterium]|nr:family membership [Acidobacteriota bacterium]